MNCQLIPTLLISFLTYNAYAFAPYHRGSTFQRSSDKVKRGSVGSTYVQSYISHDRYTTALGATGGYMNVVPLGMGGAVPDTIITNVDMENVVETSDEWIRTRTGIQERRVLLHPQDEHWVDGVNTKSSLTQLSTLAAKRALVDANVDPSEISILIQCTSSSEDAFGDATTVAHNLGLSKDVMCFDLTAACSGFLFGCITAGNFLNNTSGKAIVIGADAMSRIVDWSDRNSCILFGDGAGAMILGSGSEKNQSQQQGILGYATQSDGSGHCNLLTSYTGSAVDLYEGVTLSSNAQTPITMNGQEVYKFATRQVPEVIQMALQEANLSVDDVDHFILHQANTRILDTVAKKLGVSDVSKIWSNLYQRGNTSAASIPLCLWDCNTTSDASDASVKRRIESGDVVVMAGFGAGLSWGALVFRF